MNRFILTEDERRNISKLHKNYITEQADLDVAIQPGVFNQKVLDLQNHLNTKYKSGLLKGITILFSGCCKTKL